MDKIKRATKDKYDMYLSDVDFRSTVEFLFMMFVKSKQFWIKSAIELAEEKYKEYVEKEQQ